MDNGSLDQSGPPSQPGPAQFIENYLREFEAEEAKAARQKDPLYFQDLRRLRSRRPRTLAELATKTQWLR
jgi:hypothetical protein